MVWQCCIGCYENGEERIEEREISRKDEILKPNTCVRQGEGEVEPEVSISSLCQQKQGGQEKRQVREEVP